MTTLLLDGDMFAYRQAAAEEKPLDFGDHFILSADAENGKANLSELIDNIATRLHAERIIVTFSDDDNFRKRVLPTYKSNRKDVRKPMILGALREFLTEKFETFVRPSLEADDVLGILATHPKIIPGTKVIVSWDKDMRTIPGLHFNPAKEGADPKPKPTLVTEEQADLAFLAQTLSGDIVDGYPGCPGIGSKRAMDLLLDPYVLHAEQQEITRGKNAGTFRTVWRQTPTRDLWAAVVSQFEKAGLTAEDALTSARVARILRHTDYDFKRKEPILWQPNG